ETTVEVATGDGFALDPVLNFFLERYELAYRLELAAFIDAVESGTPPSPSGYDGLMAQRLADAATEARETGTAVKV
ncbi:MAG: inositol 2-dehydrogenase, partial [bacterium]|nr:inositol 2-dehydrogenase [bacterium]